MKALNFTLQMVVALFLVSCGSESKPEVKEMPSADSVLITKCNLLNGHAARDTNYTKNYLVRPAVKSIDPIEMRIVDWGIEDTDLNKVSVAGRVYFTADDGYRYEKGFASVFKVKGSERDSLISFKMGKAAPDLR